MKKRKIEKKNWIGANQKGVRVDKKKREEKKERGKEENKQRGRER